MKFSQNDLWKASNYLFAQWKLLGRYLGLNETDLILIEAKYMAKDGLRECCYQLLLQVNESNGSFYFLKLVKTLIELNLNLYALQLLQAFLM
jgi:hypothetical protein